MKSLSVKNILLAVLLFVTSLVLFISNNQDNQVSKLNEMFNVSSFATRIPMTADFTQYNNVYKKTIKNLNKTSRETGIKYFKRECFKGHPIKKNHLNYEKGVSNTTFQMNGSDNTHFGWLPYKTETLEEQVSFSKGTIASTLNNPNLHSGDFFLETTSPKKYNQFLKQLLINMGKPNDIKLLSPSDVTPEEDDSCIDCSSISKIIKVLILFSFIFAFIVALFSEEELSILKMNGFSLTKSLKDTCIPYFAISFIASISSGALMGISGFWKISIIAYFYIVLFFLISILLYCIGVILIRRINPVQQLKGVNYSKKSIVFVYIAKTVFMVYIFMSLVPLAELYLDASQKNISVPKYARSVSKNYGVYYPTLIGNQTPNPPALYDKVMDKQLYQYFNEKGALLINDSTNLKQNPKESRTIQVNDNYLSKFPLKDVNGKRLGIKNSNRNIVLAIPQDKLYLKNKLVTNLRQEDASKKMLGFKPKCKIYVLKNNSKMFNLNTGKYATNTIISLINFHNSTFIDRGIFNGFGQNDSLKVKLYKDNGKSYFPEYKNKLSSVNEYANHPQLLPLSQMKKNDLEMEIGDIHTAALSIALALIAEIILIIYTGKLYFEMFTRSIIIKRTGGFSIIRAYLGYWLLIGAQYIAMFTYSYIKGIPDFTVITFGLLMIEVLTSLIFITYSEKRNFRRKIHE